MSRLLQSLRTATFLFFAAENWQRATIIGLFAFVVTVAVVGLAVTLLAVTTEYFDLATETLFEAALITSLSFHLFPVIYRLIGGLANKAERQAS